MKQQFEIIQKQKQKFSSKQIPSMEILTLSHQELEALVDASLMDNPFSDIEQHQISLDAQEVDPDYKKVSKKQSEQEFEVVDDNQNDLIAYVMPQLYPYCKTKRDEEIFLVLLESLDSRGFLAESKEELCKYINIKKDALQRYLEIVQHVDPKGLASKDYCECILVQLSEIQDSALAQNLVRFHLEEINAQDYVKIAKREHTTIEDVMQALELIRLVNPIPANGFRVREKPLYIVPDAYVTKQDDQMVIAMNAKLQDKLRMNVHNYELYKASIFDEEAKAFLKKKLNDFKWLQYSVSRRSVTLEKIITFLVQYQMKFFQTGDERKLKPLRLIDIAKSLDIHSSTISRAVSHKFLQCEYGTFPLHYLMPRCYEKQGEALASIDTIKNEIREIVKGEDKTCPYSDEKIHQLLEEEGFAISRRSVALYRKECDIPSSRNRKIFHHEKGSSR